MSDFTKKTSPTLPPFPVPTESSGAYQHYVSVYHQQGFSVYSNDGGAAGSFPKVPKKRADLEAFVYIRPGAKDTARYTKVNLGRNFARNYTFDYKGILALQADKGVVSVEEQKFLALFDAARSKEGFALDDRLVAELIVHYFRRLLISSQRVDEAAYDMWKEDVAKLTTHTLIEMQDTLLAQAMGAYKARPCSVLKGYVIICLMWRSLAAATASKRVELPPLNVERLLETEGEATMKSFTSIFKMGCIRGMWETPLEEHPYVEALLHQFDFHLELNLEIASPFILTDNPLAYADSSGEVFQLCTIDYLHQIDLILLPLSSSCLLKAVRKSVERSPSLSVTEINKMLAKVANTRYIAPVADYDEWKPEMGSAAFMPTCILSALHEASTFLPTMNEDLNTTLKLIHANSSETAKHALVAAKLPADVALLGAPSEWPKWVPKEVGVEVATCSIWIHFPKRANKVIKSAIPWSLKENFQFFVHRNRLVDGCISVPTTDFTKEIAVVRITYWNAGVVSVSGKVVRDTVHNAPGKLEAKEGRLLLSFKAKVTGRAQGGHALIVVEGLTDTGDVRLRKYIWSVIL